MSELQAETVEQVAPDTTQTEPQENDKPIGSESAPEKVTFNDEQQKIVDDLAAKKTFKIREAERETARVKQELAEAKAKIPQEVRPLIPEMPDDFDENRDQLMTDRDEAIRKSAIYDANQEVILQQKGEAARKAEETRQSDLNQVFVDYEAQGKKLGVDAQELLAAGTAVGTYGLSDDVVIHIAKDKHGPLITTYLHKNPAALEHLGQLDSLSAAAYIETQVKPNAAALIKKSPSAPDPVETLSGSGISLQKRGPAGATFT